MDNYYDFTLICDKRSLSRIIGVPLNKITKKVYIQGTENCYRSFEIPKKNGGIRQINAPDDELCFIQRKLANALQNYYLQIKDGTKIEKFVSHAFEKKKSIMTNAKIHKNKRIVLNLDLSDFFDSFHFGRVQGYFAKNKYFMLSKELSTFIAQIACYNGKLPQGAPTSPIITNLICQVLDNRILYLSRKYRLDYTRYADDLSFSTNDRSFVEKQGEFLKNVKKIINDSGFSINHSKTHIQYKNNRQVVTGLTVNKKVNVNKTFYKQTRSMAQELYKSGIYFIGKDKDLVSLNKLEGRLAFINQLDNFNNERDKLYKQGNEKPVEHNYKNLNAREKMYQKFLFYKYFFNNVKPLIVTEGKTDNRYLKSALKSLYTDYPALVNKSDGGLYSFQLSFLRRSNRLHYFFDFCLDGADEMQKLFMYYRGLWDRTNYYEYFSDFTKQNPRYPVIFIFDNELNTKDKPKPIKKFLTLIKNSKDLNNYEDELKNKNYVNIKDTNLYIVIVPLPIGFVNCEIEDLFDQKTLAHEEKGKKFVRKDAGDNNGYGKDTFSKYISRDYKNIDFSGFRGLLDIFKSILDDYN
jgi:hypothetical protein